jgi:hypothetical protein
MWNMRMDFRNVERHLDYYRYATISHPVGRKKKFPVLLFSGCTYSWNARVSRSRTYVRTLWLWVELQRQFEVLRYLNILKDEGLAIRLSCSIDWFNCLSFEDRTSTNLSHLLQDLDFWAPTFCIPYNFTKHKRHGWADGSFWPANLQGQKAVSYIMVRYLWISASSTKQYSPTKSESCQSPETCSTNTLFYSRLS